MLKIVLASALVGVVSWSQVDRAEACGVKLTVRAPKIRAAKRSSNPSTILLLGTKDSGRLESQLKQAGHKVEVASTTSDAKRKSYGLVMTDPAMKSSADEAFPNSTVVEKRGSSRIAARDAETVLARAKVDSKDRTRVDQGGNRGRVLSSGSQRTANTPSRVKTAAGTLERTPVAAMESTPPRRAPVTKPTPRANIPEKQAVASTSTPDKGVAGRKDSRSKGSEGVMSSGAVAMKSPVKRPPRAFEAPSSSESSQVNARWTSELYFGSRSNALKASARNKIKSNIAWLKANPSASLTIEGHTDSVGNADFNLSLGERRAEAARDFMVSHGIAVDRIDIVSKGEEEPVYTPGSNKRNRRVVFLKNE